MNKELSEDEIELVTGGGIKDWFDKIGEMTKKVVPVGSNPILGGETDIDTRKDLYENIILCNHFYQPPWQMPERNKK